MRTERRRAARDPAAPNRARLEWDDGTASHSLPARLIDIGSGGALIEAEGRPPQRGTVWLGLEEPARAGWVAARVVRSDGPNRLGVAFAGPCPDDLLLAATLGICLDGMV